jgi:hypothetical protein
MWAQTLEFCFHTLCTYFFHFFQSMSLFSAFYFNYSLHSKYLYFSFLGSSTTYIYIYIYLKIFKKLYVCPDFYKKIITISYFYTFYLSFRSNY